MSTLEWREKNKDKMRAYRRDYSKRNVRSHYTRNDKQKQKLKEKLKAIKSVPCFDCKVSYPYYVMDFDHRDPSEKRFEVAKLCSYGSLKKLLEEIAKCDVVCSNCHGIRTHGYLDAE